MKYALVAILCLLLITACAPEVKPAEPERAIPKIEITPPKTLPDKPEYEPPPSAPDSNTT